MEFFSTLAQLPESFGPSVVTVGKFDGIHTGHRAVLSQLNALAKLHQFRSVVLTFDRNPLAVLAPERCPAPLISNSQKRELLAGAGVDVTLMIPFTKELSRLSPEEFVRQIFFDALDARLVLAGKDFRFGKDGKGNTTVLRSLGRNRFEVTLVDDVRIDGQNRSSSTRVREYLAAGNIHQAALMLGRNPSLRGRLSKANTLDPDTVEGFLPAEGYYSGLLKTDKTSYPATLTVLSRTVNVRLVDVDSVLDGKVVEVVFTERLL